MGPIYECIRNQPKSEGDGLYGTWVKPIPHFQTEIQTSGISKEGVKSRRRPQRTVISGKQTVDPAVAITNPAYATAPVSEASPM